MADYQPAGDQGDAIRQLADGILAGDRFQTLKGVTGSGKTFTMANIIQAVQKPTLIISHNKTLAAQLYREFKGFFPENAVEYFVSYYDYYQPEAYVPARDLYIEKDASINDEIDRLRLSATFSLMERRDSDTATKDRFPSMSGTMREIRSPPRPGGRPGAGSANPLKW